MYNSKFICKSVELYQTESGRVRVSFIKDLFHLVYWLIYYEVQLLIYSALVHLRACV